MSSRRWVNAGRFLDDVPGRGLLSTPGRKTGIVGVRVDRRHCRTHGPDASGCVCKATMSPERAVNARVSSCGCVQPGRLRIQDRGRDAEGSICFRPHWPDFPATCVHQIDAAMTARRSVAVTHEVFPREVFNVHHRGFRPQGRDFHVFPVQLLADCRRKALAAAGSPWTTKVRAGRTPKCSSHSEQRRLVGMRRQAADGAGSQPGPEPADRRCARFWHHDKPPSEDAPAA